jgi:HEAT repeat protein
MRLVAVAYVLFAVLLFSVSFPFYRAMSDAFRTEAELATALGLVSAAVTAASFLVSTTLANRIYRRFGVTIAALALPVVYLAGFAVWLVQFALPTAIAVRFAQQVTQRGVSNAAWSSFFNVVPAERRGQVLAFIDGVPGQLGTALSGVLLLAAAALAPGQVFWLGLLAALLCTAVVIGVRRRYGESLVRTLREGLAEQVLEGGPGIEALAHDPRVMTDLRSALASSRAGDRRLAAELLARLDARGATSELIATAADPDPGVRAAALQALAALGADGTRAGLRNALLGALDDPAAAVRVAAVAASAACDGALLATVTERVAADPSPAVRAELAVALVRAGEEDRPHAILAALLDSEHPHDRAAGLDAVRRLGGHAPSPRITASLDDAASEVRAAAVHAIAAVSEGIDDVDGLLVRALHDETRAVRQAAARALAARAGPVGPLLAVLEGKSEDAQGAALAALDGRGPEVAVDLVGWAEGQVRRAIVLRRHALALAQLAAAEGRSGTTPAGAAASAAFLRFLLERRGSGIEERLLVALAVLGAPEASGLIRRCLGSNEPETRAQAIEALETLGHRRLGRAVVELLEIEPADGTRQLHEVLAGLVDDPDPWVRALALRTLSEHLSGEWRAVMARGAGDRDPIVRAVIGSGAHDGGRSMPETGATLGDIDRILFLRRVPLFAELGPEDLQRLAMTATERFYPGGEALVREGELGNELVVIVEGTVRIVRHDADGERLLRTYAAGDHIGELAVLRERPRAATVLADEPGVRGLVIGGDGLKAILRERPEAAWAMLATLAERIGTQ